MHLAELLGDPVEDAEEEAFLVFSQAIPSQSLGFIDPKTSTLELNVGGHDLVIYQSRGLLDSNRKEGTTGAVVWSITPLLATWLSNPLNPLSLVRSSSTILELGAGVSGIIALTLGPKVARYIATDQSYVLKLLRQNVAENIESVFRTAAPKTGGIRKHGWQERIKCEELDWETDVVRPEYESDMVIASDCIYNESLIEPLNDTLASVCALRQSSTINVTMERHSSTRKSDPTVALIAQQLRSPEVFEAWLKSFCSRFRAWRVPDTLLDEGLREGSGYVIYVGILKEAQGRDS